MRRMVEGGRAILSGSEFALRSAMLVLAIASGSGAALDGDDEGPELSPPSEMTKAARPTNPAPAPARPRPSSPSIGNGNGRAVLALPGITTPANRAPSVIVSTPSTSASTSTPGPLDGPGELTLDGPLEMPGVATPRPARPGPGPSTGRANRALPLEPLPMDETIGPLEPGARSGPSARRPSTVEPPNRRGRLFGLAPTPLPRSPGPGRSVAADSLDEPEPDFDPALKKRIEKQAREAVGDRVRSLEVRLVGKNASIRARGVRFYQKRAIRKSLESIPALSGLRSSIEVGD